MILKLLVWLIGTILLLQHFSCLEVEFDRVELLNASYVEDFYNISLLRVAKYNHTAHVLNIEVELYKDLSSEMSVEVCFYYNRFNNNQYNKSPMQIKKSSLCDLGEKYYKGLLMEQMKDFSNLPQYGPSDEFCPFKKGAYWLKNYMLKCDKLPQSTPSGNWIAELIIYREDQVVAVINLYMRTIGTPMGRRLD